MRLLLDTHTLIWAVDDPTQLGPRAVAQAIVESIPVVSADAQLDGYGVTRIW